MHHAATAESDWWLRLVERWPYSEKWLAVSIASVVHAVSLWVPCLFFTTVAKMGWLADCKLPRERKDMDPKLPRNKSRDWDALIEQIFGTILLVPLFVYLIFPSFSLVGISLAKASPSMPEMLTHVALMIIGCDFLFYWFHRAFHHPWLYRFHKKHHEYQATNIWASEYFDVVDMVFNILPGVIPGLLIRTHFVTLMLFTLIRGWQTAMSHAGYDLWFDPFNRGIFHGCARRHDFHHSHNVGCYGDWMPLWDYLAGTDVHYRAYWEKRDKAARNVHAG
uniref:Fatty acid hydroxylase domain-containing protein n=2 Tax=Lotharella globosa TaxID=91324 RepID=A0A7S4DRB0_9EUKA|mmetsp:Transcript_2096/g.4213  ORF Transcript_2096/g.4213 Transcript_2096/m.4213 type:complete len:278 (-) Transcript_2096:118-951(-)